MLVLGSRGCSEAQEQGLIFAESRPLPTVLSAQPHSRPCHTTETEQNTPSTRRAGLPASFSKEAGVHEDIRWPRATEADNP